MCFKMNQAELSRSDRVGQGGCSLGFMKTRRFNSPGSTARMVFVTLAEEGIVGQAPGGDAEHVPALPVRGEIDIVGAGDAVTANLTAALAAGADAQGGAGARNARPRRLSIHQLGTTGQRRFSNWMRCEGRSAQVRAIPGPLSQPSSQPLSKN